MFEFSDADVLRNATTRAGAWPALRNQARPQGQACCLSLPITTEHTEHTEAKHEDFFSVASVNSVVSPN
jgi:hypothetical protein